MTTDIISDLIIQLKNAGLSKKETVSFADTNLRFAVLEKLAKKGFIKGVTKKGKKDAQVIEAGIAYYENGKPRISDVKRISKPSRRVYRGYSEIVPVKQGYGSLIISTPKGILSDDEARREKVGGEVLFSIW
jgi:small subunit ribosomal protein S8